MALDRDKVDAICRLIQLGSSLRKACAAVDITKSTFFDWIDNSHKGVAGYEGIADQYARAREILIDGFEDDIVELSDVKDPNSVTVEPADRRTAIDAKKWLLSKLHAKKYGDKMETTLKGDKENPIVTVNTTNLSTEQLKAIEAIMSGKGSDDTNT